MAAQSMKELGTSKAKEEPGNSTALTIHAVGIPLLMGRRLAIAVAKLVTMPLSVGTRTLSAMVVESVGISRERVGVSKREQPPHLLGRRRKQLAQ